MRQSGGGATAAAHTRSSWSGSGRSTGTGHTEQTDLDRDVAEVVRYFLDSPKKYLLLSSPRACPATC